MIRERADIRILARLLGGGERQHLLLAGLDHARGLQYVGGLWHVGQAVLGGLRRHCGRFQGHVARLAGLHDHQVVRHQVVVLEDELHRPARLAGEERRVVAHLFMHRADADHTDGDAPQPLAIAARLGLRQQRQQLIGQLHRVQEFIGRALGGRGGFDTYRDCGYRKTAGTCRNPTALPDYPVPALPLRKGDLNQSPSRSSTSCAIAVRVISSASSMGSLLPVDQADLVDPIEAKRDRLLAEFSVLHAVSAKLIAMMLSSLLHGGGSQRPGWLKVGRSLVTIDSLVHNFLHRTGVLVAFDQVHRYRPACHGPRGCATVIYQLADRIDAREVNPAYPQIFPRFIEFAIWAFCAETRSDICNGRQIDDRFPCTRMDCPVGSRCARIPLRPSPSDEVFHGQAAKSRREQPRPLPFRQGNLDGLCGIYALINAIRLVTAEQLDLSNVEWAGVFARLLAGADDDRGVAKVVTGGIGTWRLIALARAAIDHIAEQYGIELGDFAAIT